MDFYDDEADAERERMQEQIDRLTAEVERLTAPDAVSAGEDRAEVRSDQQWRERLEAASTAEEVLALESERQQEAAMRAMVPAPDEATQRRLIDTRNDAICQAQSFEEAEKIMRDFEAANPWVAAP